jgi:hypothetical protein
VTTSYVSPAMRSLDEDCKKAGITVINEVGLDPGIDHLWAVKAISEVHKQGGKVGSSPLSYSSFFLTWWRNRSGDFILGVEVYQLQKMPTIH